MRMTNRLLFAVTAASALAALNPAFAEPAKPKGLGDPGTLSALKIEPTMDGKPIVLRGRDARQQVFVTGNYSTGQLRDHTRKVQYTADPAGIVNVDATGLVTPIKDGDVTLKVTANGLNVSAPIHVEGVEKQIPINFKNQIVPIFTKLGCNSGGCHGKASGQNGFKLSLLGFYPDEDHEFLVKENRGRRL